MYEAKTTIVNQPQLYTRKGCQEHQYAPCPPKPAMICIAAWPQHHNRRNR